MTLRQLEYLIAVADHGSFTVAAAELHVSQPSLSQQIRQLEEEIGGPLLDRTSSGVVATEAGHVLIAKARTALQATGDGRRMAERELARPGGVCVAMAAGTPAAPIAAAVARFRAGNPRADVRWHQHESRERVLEKVGDGAGVVGVCLAPESWEGTVAEVASSLLVRAEPRERPAEPLVVARTGFEGLAPSRPDDRAPLDVPDLDAALCLVEAGAAAAYVPALAVDGRALRAVPVTGVPRLRFVALVSDAAIGSARALMAEFARAAPDRRPNLPLRLVSDH